jgi:hypothetical protein
MRQTENVAWMEKQEVCVKPQSGNLVEEVNVNKRIILKWVLNK